MTSSDRIVGPRFPRLRVGIGAAIVLLLAGVAVAVLTVAFGDRGSTRSIPSDIDSSESPGARDEADTAAGTSAARIFVHLLGAVARPGLYELREGDRAVDAIAAAGGFAADADQTHLNLARPLVDGEQIRVPVIGEVPPPPPAAAESTGSASSGPKVNLNTADAAALDTLPGVGPATARRILEWREENGRFSSVEDLLSVTGIGDKTFAELEGLVTV